MRYVITLLIISGCILMSSFVEPAFGADEPQDEFEKAIIRQAEEQKEAQLKDYLKDYYYAQGKDYFKKGDYAQALKKFRRALYWDPDFQSALTYIELTEKKLGGRQVKENAHGMNPAAESISIKTYPGSVYRIESGDTLEILVGAHPELSKELAVRSDGTVFYPIIGSLRVMGLTLAQLEQEIAKGISSEVREPAVAVTVKSLAEAVK